MLGPAIRVSNSPEPESTHRTLTGDVLHTSNADANNENDVHRRAVLSDGSAVGSAEFRNK
jgi:hypothetical protein